MLEFINNIFEKQSGQILEEKSVEIFNKVMDKFPGKLLMEFSCQLLTRNILKKFQEKLLWEEILEKSSVHLLLKLLVGILERISSQTPGFLMKLQEKFPVKLPN